MGQQSVSDDPPHNFFATDDAGFADFNWSNLLDLP
jgi:hypothetical protein